MFRERSIHTDLALILAIAAIVIIDEMSVPERRTGHTVSSGMVFRSGGERARAYDISAEVIQGGGTSSPI